MQTYICEAFIEDKSDVSGKVVSFGELTTCMHRPSETTQGTK